MINKSHLFSILKALFWITSGAVGLYVFSQTLNEEGKEFDHIFEASGLMTSWKNKPDIVEACSKEHEAVSPDSYVTPDTISKLVDKGTYKCAGYNSVFTVLNVAYAAGELIIVPVRANIPYELAKKAAESKKPLRCTDYIEPIIYACPKTSKIYLKPVKRSHK